MMDGIIPENNKDTVEDTQAMMEADNHTDTSHGPHVYNQVTNELETAIPGDRNENRKDSKGTPSRILSDLSIEELASNKFGMKDILKVSKSSLEGVIPATMKENILYTISKFIMLDRSPYNMPLNITNNQEADNDIAIPVNNENLGIEDELLAMFVESKPESQNDNQNSLHPSDVIVILINCCDTFVRQIIFQKMLTCQLAIPLILPDLINNKDMFLLWPMRHLYFKWKTKISGSQEGNPVTKGFPLVSAIRLGTFSNSKSKILNDVLCTHSHDIFFHKHCVGGQLPRKISNGVVELAWYLPGGKTKDSFENIWTLANLRGDAKDHDMQFHLLKEVSSAMLVFLSITCIDDVYVLPILEHLSNTNQQLIFVFLDPVSPVSVDEKKKGLGMFSKIMKNKKVLFVAESGIGKEKNAASLKIEIRQKIQSALISKKDDSQKHSTMEEISHRANTLGIRVDENSESCQKGKKFANKIMTKIRTEKPEARKKKSLPLQGKFLEWSKYSKQLKRMEVIDFDKIQEKMQNCRKDQFDMVQNMAPVMEDFINFLMDTDETQVKMFFLQWMKLYLDAESNKHLPDHENKYHALWNNIKSNEGSDTKELTKLETTLDELSFGLEHIFREIGQVYESIKEVKRDKKLEDLANNLSNFAADLLINGYPLEIMDGDSAGLPLTWITAVFDGLKNKLGDKKVYVISVLGVQSSGKSTLLNAMFGLNFSVSAGRCTKGVFAQLISVDESLCTEMGYEYILVLDSEGLRAMELANIKRTHDNELASFIIGMGAVTIVNNKGENTAEITDILEICVHAFLRMRLANDCINLQPGCFFAHQNVPDVSAESKLLYGYKKLKDQLDDMATTAAKHLNISEINSFSDVIEFDVNKQIWYFPNLWIGDPPMAPANPGYSETVLKLKIDILKYPKKNNSITFSEFQERVTDLWKAILNENFVFSFKNSMEVRSYSLLEEKVLEVSTKFHNKVKKKMHDCTNKINSCENDFNTFKQDTLADIENYIGECQILFKKEMDDFFKSAPNKDIINQWQSFATHKLEDLELRLRTSIKNRIKTSVELREANYEHLKEMGKYKNDIEKFVKEIVATQMASGTPKVKLNEMFETQWKKFLGGLNFPKIKEEKNVSKEIWDFLVKVYNNHITILGNDKYTKYMTIENSDFDLTQYFKRLLGEFGKNAYAKSSQAIRLEMGNFSYNIEQHIQEYLDDIVDQDFDNYHLWNIKFIFDDLIKNFNDKQSRYTLSIKYVVKVFFHYLLNAVPHFEKMQRNFREKNDLRNMLNMTYKKQIEAIFIGKYSQYNKEKTAAIILGDKFKTAIIASLNEPLSDSILLNLKSEKEEFQSKIKLISKVMRDLKKEDNFTYYNTYIQNPKKSLESWIKKYVTEYCTEITNGQSMLGKEANKILKMKVDKIILCIEKVPENSTTNFQTWLKEFNNAANEIIPLTDTSFNLFDMELITVKNFDYFKEEIIEILRKIQEGHEITLNSWGQAELEKLVEKPHIAIAKTILGCMQKCPFCAVVCSLSLDHPGKDHSAPRHYPRGLCGGYKEGSNELLVNYCTDDMARNTSFRCVYTRNAVEFRNYRSVNKYFASWSIVPDSSLDVIAYWKWVLARYKKEFAKYHDKKCNLIPNSWKNINDAYVEKSIKLMFE